MAHHQKHEADSSRRSSAMQAFLKMFNLSNAPTVPLAEDDVVGEADEPPDDHLSALHAIHRDSYYPKSPSMPPNPRSESLLTRAIQKESTPEEYIHSTKLVSRGLSTASSHSATSMASTAELTSDASPARSVTPSPPIPHGFPALPHSKLRLPPSTVVFAPVTKDDKPAAAENGEAAIEKTLGRKRCIMFACGGTKSPDPAEQKPVPEEPKKTEAPTKRKCTLTFACPTRKDAANEIGLGLTTEPQPAAQRQSSPPIRRQRSHTYDEPPSPTSKPEISLAAPTPLSPHTFHEFGSSHEEADSWVNKAVEPTRRLTLNDCMQKENAIRKLGEEAEEEAEEEEREEDELEQLDDRTHLDDFASSESDAGNESDDEGGFAESDDEESDAGSDYQFWAPAHSTTTAATSVENVNISHFSNRGRSRASSPESIDHATSPVRPPVRKFSRPRHAKLARMRPGTPELPDSTDFVCGTLDEDRPLEAAYISCLEQRKRQKHIPIPQDIDPSFPTSDPEDDEEEEDGVEESLGAGGPMWLQDQFTGFDQGHARPKTPISHKTPSPASPKNEFPFPRPNASRRSTNRSPPPKPRRGRSPPPRKLFGHSPARMHSPPPSRLRSPPASPNNVPRADFARNHLAQRPMAPRGPAQRTASLPRVPNPFFKHFNVGSPSISNVASGAVSPAMDETFRPDMHVRGPVDIVMGLERKRQKRKEKFWRQHCRKIAKEHAERKTVPGRGAERMRELGLECAERNRGYGLAGAGQGTQLVISL